MGRRVSRSLFPLLAIALFFAGWTPHPARAADDQPAASVGLSSETAWTGPDRPLVLRFRAANDTGTALDRLTVVLAIAPRTRSRSAYQLSLEQDPPVFSFARSFPQEGTIEPAESRGFSVKQRLTGLPLFTDSGLYPLKVQLLSEERVVATLRTPMIYLIEPPVTPLHLAWTWVLSEPLQMAPGGVLVPGPIERDIAPGGRIVAMVTAMDAATPAPIDLAMSPVLAEELALMARGYRSQDALGKVTKVAKGTGGAADAERVLGTLRRIAGRPRTELIALPFGDARIPSVFGAGLGSDVGDLLVKGRSEVASVLGADASTVVGRPPLSQLDPGSAGRLAALGTSIVVLDSNVLPQQPGASFNPPPVFRLSNAPGTTAVVADPEVVSVSTPLLADPGLAARAALGELAAVWQEFPGTPGRGAAVLFSETSNYPPGFYDAFAGLVRASPWLKPLSASAMASLVREPGRAELPSATYPGLSSGLVAALLRARGALDLFLATARGETALLERMRSDLLRVEGGTMISDPALGLTYIESVRRRIGAVYRQVSPPASGSIVTLTSQRGAIPLTLRNDNAFSLLIAVRLVADRRMSFPNGSRQTLTLPAHRPTRFLLDVRAATTGRFPVTLQILPPVPCADCTIAETQLIVRSTAYNRVALLVTIGAALFLFGWWGRRFLPRRKS